MFGEVAKHHNFKLRTPHAALWQPPEPDMRRCQHLNISFFFKNSQILYLLWFLFNNERGIAHRAFSQVSLFEKNAAYRCREQEQ